MRVSSIPPNPQDLALAYRKAKVDLYYMGQPCSEKLVEYEQDLSSRLENLQQQIATEENPYFSSKGFLGGYTLVPHKLEFDDSKGTDSKSSFVESDPWKRWQSSVEKHPFQWTAEFRLMAQPSMSLVVFSTYWIQAVGHLYDACLNDEHVKGNRLRRTRAEDRRLNPLSLGTFEPYLHKYREWQDGALQAMRSGLKDGKKLIAITADLSSFYHELNPGFLLKSEFLNLLDIKLSEDQNKLTRQLITALESWAQLTPLKRGLPVGLPVSALIANLALFELDQLFLREVAPLHYGRYVDDIILVFENHNDFQSGNEVWEWIERRCKGKLETDENLIRFCPDYHSESSIVFNTGKNKIFNLTGDSGVNLVDTVERQIRERSSEWRSLPDLPESADAIASKLYVAIQQNGERADTLRKADHVSLKRADFAILLRDHESYGRDLAPEQWETQRSAFFEAAFRYLFVPEQLFELYKYLARILKLAISCGDFEQFFKMLKRLDEILRDGGKVEKTIKHGNGKPDENQETVRLPQETILKVWKQQLSELITESVYAAFPLRITEELKTSWTKAAKEHASDLITFDFERIISRSQEYFCHDLGHVPFRSMAFPSTMRPATLSRKRLAQMVPRWDSRALPKGITEGVEALAVETGFGKKIPVAYAFPTRPFSLAELYLILPDPFTSDGQEILKKVLLGTRGFMPDDGMPSERVYKNQRTIEFPFIRTERNPQIAITSWLTKDESWMAAVCKHPEPDPSRYQRLNRLVNSILNQHLQVDYLLFPELSIPAKWVLRIAMKLHHRRISLIAGVDYIHAKGKKVSNQVWACFPHDCFGFPSLALYRQDKQRPAKNEREELDNKGYQMIPEKPWRKPPVIRHGGFCFAMLICSELTNVTYRSNLRGKIDALFVPEWNQDLETFNSLVEATALDIHCFVVQCNNRAYGDSRVRVPHKEGWMRDMIRLKGGKNDYFVIGEIGIQSLRAFQSSLHSPDKPFKPTPDGFSAVMASARKTLPLPKEP
jgi:hypothetical protein